MIKRLLRFLYPPKCVLCQRLLEKGQTDLCHDCRINAPEYISVKKNISFVAGWNAVWYYKDTARESILRYKFGKRVSYADPYGRILGLHLMQWQMDGLDLITWVPVSAKRRRSRGYDQVALLAKATAKALRRKASCTLIKHRDNVPQSSLEHPAQRRANVLGVYRVKNPKAIQGKTVLLLDDVITTGSTVSECARVLLTAGAKEVYCAALAATSYTKR